MTRHRLWVVLALLFCLIPSISYSDSITNVVGTAGRGSDQITWRHLMAVRYSEMKLGGFNPVDTQNFQVTYSLAAGCQGLSCATIAPSSVLPGNIDGNLAGNQAMVTLAQLYAANDATGPPFNWSRITCCNPLLVSGNSLNVFVRTNTGEALQQTRNIVSLCSGTLDSVNLTSGGSCGGVLVTQPYLVTTGGNSGRFWSSLFTGANPTSCNGCLAAGMYVTSDTPNNNWRSWPGAPSQGHTLFNTNTLSAVNTAVTATITAAANERGHVYNVSAFCSAGTALLRIESPSGTNLWETPAGAVGTALFTKEYNTPFTSAVNTAIEVELTACGAGNTGRLMVQADRW